MIDNRPVDYRIGDIYRFSLNAYQLVWLYIYIYIFFFFTPLYLYVLQVVNHFHMYFIVMQISITIMFSSHQQLIDLLNLNCQGNEWICFAFDASLYEYFMIKYTARENKSDGA